MNRSYTKVLRPSLLGIALFMTFTALAGPGHDHGDAPAVAVSGAFPQRLPDGAVFMPKSAQRQLRVQTQLVRQEQRNPVIELPGTVVMDPNASGKVQTIISGRIQAGPNGLPSLGQRVEKGQILAYVSKEVDASGRSLSEVQLERLSALSESIPRRRLEQAQAAVANEVLLAPISGVIATTNAAIGQVVEERDTLFEVVDPKRLLVEGLLYDTTLASAIGNASIRVGTSTIPLTLIGVSGSLRDQALPVRYRVKSSGDESLQLNLLTTVYAELTETISGFVLPVEAVVRGPSNQSIVWIKHDPERFEPRLVSFQVVSAAQVAVTSGLNDRDRVVTVGASLINQVR
ncbi:MAG: efflux RND transporter periplasmic adaptor subunit [Burkholderiaceae bacterium]